MSKLNRRSFLQRSLAAGAALILWFGASWLFLMTRERLGLLPGTLVPLIWIILTARAAMRLRSSAASI